MTFRMEQSSKLGRLVLQLLCTARRRSHLVPHGNRNSQDDSNIHNSALAITMHQAEVFDHICQETEEYGLVYARMGVVEYQKCLHDIVLEGEINFYAQDEDGLPAERFATRTGDDTFYTTMLVRNNLDRLTWKSVASPKNWKGGPWPPYRRRNLFGRRTQDETCAECEKPNRYNDDRQDDDYFSWVFRKLDFLYEDISIWKAKRTGYGLSARQRSPKGTHMG